MKEAYYTILTQAIQMGGGLLVFKILTSKLSSSDFGIYALTLSFSAIIFTFPFTAIQHALTKYSSVISEKKAMNVYKTIFILDICFFVIYLFFSFVLFSINLITIDTVSYVLIVMYIVTEVLKINNYIFLNSLRKRKKYFFSVFFEFSIKLALLTIFTNSTNEVFTIFVVANILTIVFSKPDNLNLGIPNRIQLLYWSKMIYIFALPLAIWGIFGWMRDMSNRWIIEYYLTLNDVAVFAIMNTIVTIIPGVLQSFFGMYFMPILYKKEREYKGAIRLFTNKLLIFGTMFILILTVIISFFADFIVLILSTQEYLRYSWMITPMFFAFAFFSLTMSATAEIFANNMTKLLLVPNIISGIVSVIAFIVLISMYGLIGSVWAFFITYVTYSFFVLYVLRKFRSRLK